MSRQKKKEFEWLALFEDSELKATISLLADPIQLTTHLDYLSRLLEKYIEDHRIKVITAWEWWSVELTEAMKLLAFLHDLKRRAMSPEHYNMARPVASAEPELTTHFESFWSEGWHFKQPLQDLGGKIKSSRGGRSKGEAYEPLRNLTIELYEKTNRGAALDKLQIPLN